VLNLRYGAWWLGAGIFMLIVVLVLCLASMPTVLPPLSLSDKLMHLLTFMTLMLWFGGIYPVEKSRSLILPLLVYGALIELLQLLGGSRSAEWLDLVADAAGIGLGWLLLRIGLAGWSASVERWLGVRVPG